MSESIESKSQHKHVNNTLLLLHPLPYKSNRKKCPF